MTVVALSETYYKDFDEKNKDFIEACIDFIEKRFTGIETLVVTEKNPISGEEEKIDLKYYKSI